MHGLPVTIKDLAWTTDFPTESGTHINKGFQAKIDNPFVTRLREAGGIVIGKTTTSEFGWTGVSRSPLDGHHAQPVEEGLQRRRLGRGGGGVGGRVFGDSPGQRRGGVDPHAEPFQAVRAKPSYGRVPNHPVGAGDYTSHIGPMTWTVGDGALMQVMSGPHPLDHTSLGGLAGGLHGPVGRGVACWSRSRWIWAMRGWTLEVADIVQGAENFCGECRDYHDRWNTGPGAGKDCSIRAAATYGAKAVRAPDGPGPGHPSW